MTTYAIGDIQGCFEPLQRLLEKLRFDPADDQLWFAGDLVNRGPDSLATLRFVKSLGDSAVTVLGNHDIHLLALYYGLRPMGKDPTLTQVIDAADVNELIEWLQQQPILHVLSEFALVHAGIHPQWSIDEATMLAGEIETKLQSVRHKDALAELYGPTTGSWQSVRETADRLRYALNVFTRMRFCTASADPDYRHNGAPGDQPGYLLPWFDIKDRAAKDTMIIFGHWASLGAFLKKNVCALDSGCVWGNALTALNLDTLSLSHVSCVPADSRI